VDYEDDSEISAASEDTVRVGCKGGPLRFNPGPPFAVGDRILCELPGDVLQKAFVLVAAHPTYKIRTERGRTVTTHFGESRLKGSYAPGQFAEDVIYPFGDINTDKLKMGSYGIHVDSQIDSLRKVKEAKDFAKAVKADDAEIPLWLWNDRIRSENASQEERERLFTWLRVLGHGRYVRALTRDSAAYMLARHGSGWQTKARRSKAGPLTERGRNREAIASMLWHNGHTSWFEFNAGSRLIHFRFPMLYREEAQDGVAVWVERPGPITRERLSRR
jgi:hypothetical protein